MAPGLRLWGGAGLGACALIAAALLPPRGGVHARGFGIVFNEPRPLTAARRRAQALGAEWRAATAQLRVAEARTQLESDARRQRADHSGVVLLIVGPDSLARRVRPGVAAALDTVWRHLGLSETKVSVVFVVDLAVPPTSGRTYVFPDSTDRTTCAVWQASSYWIRPGRPFQGGDNFLPWLQNVIGPCAFYAAFGSPGKPVRHWLGARNFDLALYPSWMAADRPTPTDRLRAGPRGWWWEAIYRSGPATVGCLGGRPAACRAAVLRNADSDDSLERTITSDNRWWLGQSLIPGERYLADVAAAVGPERFLRFWNSPLPVDTSLALALHEPIGDWTVRWERAFSRPLPLGPAAPFWPTAFALLIAAGAVALAALGASRRQVR